MRRPWAVHRASQLSIRVLGLLKRPLTVVVLDEVAAVIQTGHYTKNISDALRENRVELKRLVAEKVSRDPSTRLVSKLPGYDTIVSEVSETVMRVLIDMLSDPRMDELVSDLLRNNLEQIRVTDLRTMTCEIPLQANAMTQVNFVEITAGFGAPVQTFRIDFRGPALKNPFSR